MIIYLALVSCFFAVAFASKLGRMVSMLDDALHPREPHHHSQNIEVGLFFEHLYKVDDKDHYFEADFIVTQRWFDGRNYSVLFNDPELYDKEQVNCDSTSGNMPHGLSDVSKAASGSGSGLPRKFLEIGHDEMSYFWSPDFHISNIYDSKMRVNAELMRFYEDGYVELIELIWAKIRVLSPEYYAYPWDVQDLDVHLESMSHTTSRITLSVLEDFNGLKESMVENWPGWDYVDSFGKTTNITPDYAHRNKCRTEKRSRFTFTVRVSRTPGNWIRGVFLPSMLLVMASWGSFYIPLKQLMPRVAMAFISFLTLTNWSSSLLSKLPSVSYACWLDFFMEVIRFFVFTALLVTVAGEYISHNISEYTATQLDLFARIFIPLDFAITMVCFFSLKTGGTLDALQIISYANMLCTLLASVSFVYVRHKRFKQYLCKYALTHHMESISKLDHNEMNYLFQVVDDNKSGLIQTEEILAWLFPDMQTDGLHHSEIFDRLTTKFGTNLNRERFRDSFNDIMSEVSLWERTRKVGHQL